MVLNRMYDRLMDLMVEERATLPRIEPCGLGSKAFVVWERFLKIGLKHRFEGRYHTIDCAVQAVVLSIRPRGSVG